MKNIFSAIIIFIFMVITSPSLAENFIVKGDMVSAIHYELQHQITAGDAMKKLTLSFVIPQSFESPTYNQQIANFKIKFSPEAQDSKITTDNRGNKIIIVGTWSSVPDKINAVVSFDAKNITGLKAFETQAPFPLSGVPEDLKVYLQETAQVQTKDMEIRQLALKLTKDVKTQFDAVQRVISWVVDNVRYVSPTDRYDALYSLQSGKGNCQNFSHLSAALLRSVGVPVRIINGVTLNQPFDVAWDRGTLTFKMGQGRHSWVEVWFPDQGWVPYDPQNMQFFVSNRFVRIEAGVDNNETKNDGLIRWVQASNAAVKPKLQETIDANMLSDSVNVQGLRQAYGPKNLLLGPNVKAEFKKIEIVPPPPPVVITEEEKENTALYSALCLRQSGLS